MYKVESASSFSPTRYQLGGEYNSRFPQGLMPVPQIQGHEEDVLQLRKQLAEFSVKEAQVRNEKYLGKGIAYIRLAFDQRQ